MASPSYVAEPQIQRLSQLIREIAQGFIQVPRFQRPIVWTDEQRLELFRSVSEGTPIGSILVWRTSLRNIRVFETLGPHRLERQQGSAAEFVSYLLDGHQRLSTLFGALQARSGSYAVSDDGNRWEVFYDLDRRDFTFDPRKEGADRQRLLPLSSVLDSRALLRFQRSLAELEDEEELIRRCDDLATAIQEYKIAVIPIVTDDIDVATRTFQRINSEGTSMNHVHMVAALTWQADFDLTERLPAIREEVLAPLGWGGLDDRLLLSSCKVTLGLDLLEGDADEIAKRIRSRPEVLEEAAQHVAGAATFLREECHLGSPRLLPYSYIPVLLAEAFRLESSPSPELKASLKRWFWWVCYEYFAISSNSSRLRGALDMVRGIVNGDSSPVDENTISGLEPLPERFDFRLARCKLLALQLARLQRVELETDEAERLLAERGHEAMQSLLVRHRFPRADINSPANRILARPEELSEVRGLLDTRQSSAAPSLAHHLVSDEALLSLRNGDPGEFLILRRIELEQLEWDFCAQQGILNES
ncbi:MAG TPA: DUF262 domain-containing protein [Thermoanaerobaculia bacterium]|nr:DUF262 domain-containing protein [Thermoanaerobaculia bacterium]